jgi:hypothetical protein
MNVKCKEGECHGGQFIKEINDSDVGQLLGLAANFSGTIQGIAAFISLFQQSDSDKILSRLANCGKISNAISNSWAI